MIVAQGGVTGGLSLYAKGGRPKYGGGRGKGGTAAIYVDGQAAGSGRIEQTEAFLFSADETLDVGDEYGSPVTTDYHARKFTGVVNWVEIDVGLDDHNHLIKPEDRVNLAMAFQWALVASVAAEPPNKSVDLCGGHLLHSRCRPIDGGERNAQGVYVHPGGNYRLSRGHDAQ